MLVRLYAVCKPFVRAWYALQEVRFASGRTLKGRTKGSTVKVQLKYGFYGTTAVLQYGSTVVRSMEEERQIYDVRKFTVPPPARRQEGRRILV